MFFCPLCTANEDLRLAYKGIFFDLYGTLLIYHDPPALWADWLASCYESLTPSGLSISLAEFAQLFDGLFSRPEPPATEDGLTIYERRIKSTVIELLPAIRDIDIQRAATASATAFQKHMTLDPEAISTLNTLKSTMALALITNFDHPPFIHSMLRKLELAKFFAPVLISGETGYKKPHPYMFLLALEQTGLQPDEVVYVGDTADDIKGARAAGMQPILIQRNDNRKDHTISDFNTDPRPPSDTKQTKKTDDCRSITALSQIKDLL
jgi:putative hydrolase of the HAD superfamily